MRTVAYGCDWCKRPIPNDEARRIEVTPPDQILPVYLKAEICEGCLKEVLNTAQRIAVRAQDLKELGEPQS